MVINFCPTCGAHKEEGSDYCRSCGLDFKKMKMENQQEMENVDELNEELKAVTKDFMFKRYAPYLPYIVNSCMVLCLVWLYMIARRGIVHDDFTFLFYIAPIVFVFLFLITSLFCHSRIGGYALFGNLVISLLFIIPFLFLFFDYTNVYSDGLIPRSEQMIFIIIAMAPLTVLSMIVLSIAVVIIWPRINPIEKDTEIEKEG